MWDLVFYESESGRSPVRAFLDELPGQEADRVVRGLELLESYGIALGLPHVRRIQGSDLWELRIRGRVDHRVFYVTLSGRRILLLHAFTKKSQRTPPREIRTAQQRLAEFRRKEET